MRALLTPGDTEFAVSYRNQENVTLCTLSHRGIAAVARFGEQIHAMSTGALMRANFGFHIGDAPKIPRGDGSMRSPTFAVF